MAHLALVASSSAYPPRAQVAHDLRNILTSIGLHLETLQRLSGPSGAKAAHAAYALLTRGVALCNGTLDGDGSAQNGVRRRRVELTAKAKQSNTAPHGYGLAIARELAERNGGTVTLAPSAKGAHFEVKLASLVSVLPDKAATR